MRGTPDSIRRKEFDFLTGKIAKSTEKIRKSNKTDKQGKTALELARSKGNESVVKALQADPRVDRDATSPVEPPSGPPTKRARHSDI